MQRAQSELSSLSPSICEKAVPSQRHTSFIYKMGMQLYSSDHSVIRSDQCGLCSSLHKNDPSVILKTSTPTSFFLIDLQKEGL